MKKLFLTLVVAFAGILSADAQVWMGGSFGFNTTKENKDADPKYTYSVAPEIGCSIAPRWDLAVAFGLSGESQKQELEDVTKKNNSWEIAIEPYARFTTFELGKVGFFIDGGLKFTHGTIKTTETISGHDVEEKNHSDSFWVGFQPGVKFAASDKITFAARIGSFGYSAVKDGPTNFGLNVNNSAFTLGLWWSL